MSRDTNVGLVCNEHAPKPQTKWAEKEAKWFKGKCVKKAFDVTEYKDFKKTAAEFKKQTGSYIPNLEHMWVKVTGTKDGKLVGTMANMSVFPGGPKFDQEVTVQLHEISDVSETAD